MGIQSVEAGIATYNPVGGPASGAWNRQKVRPINQFLFILSNPARLGDTAKCPIDFTRQSSRPNHHLETVAAECKG